MLEKSIEYFIKKFSERLINTKIIKEEFNIQMKIIKKIAYSRTRDYVAKRYDIMSKFDQLRDILNPKISETLKPISETISFHFANRDHGFTQYFLNFIEFRLIFVCLKSEYYF